jgi:nucleotide-binding universal stress UspA family protein
MKKVIAALDNSLAARGVLATAANLSRLFGAEVEALHIVEDGDRVASEAALSGGAPLRHVRGPTVPALIEASAAEDVVALVVGTRGLPGRPVGSTAIEVITSVLKPVVVVPLDGQPHRTLERVLVPLEGTMPTSLAPRGIIELAQDANLDLIILHVHDAASLPAFTDQPQHQARAWGEEFLARYCPWGIGKVRLELRVGRREDEILAAVEDTQAQLIALGWSQELDFGRASIVREVLRRGRVPVLLVPVHVRGEGAGAREESWNRSRSLPI